MSHIAEGLLHAHLDGALGPEDGYAWSEAEAHLAVCEDCRCRLEEARELRDAATALLAGASLEATPRPGFDSLLAEATARREASPAARSRARAGAGGAGSARPPSKAPWWSSPIRLAWAASLVLAVGAGWMGRQLMIEQGDSVPRIGTESEPTASSRDASDGAAASGEFRGDDSDEASRLDKPAERRAAGEEARPEAPVGRAEAEALADAERTDEVRRQNERRQDVEDRAAPPEEPVRERAAAVEEPAEQEAAKEVEPSDADAADPAAAARAANLEAQAFAAKDVDEALCYAAAPPGRDQAEADGPEQLRLEPNGTAGLRLDRRPLVGFWDAPEPSSRHLRVTDGTRWFDLRLTETEDGLRGTMAAATPPGEDAVAADRLERTVEFSKEGCP